MSLLEILMFLQDLLEQETISSNRRCRASRTLEHPPDKCELQVSEEHTGGVYKHRCYRSIHVIRSVWGALCSQWSMLE